MAGLAVAKSFSERVLIRPAIPGHGLVDDGHGMPGRIVAVELTAAQEARSDGGEISGIGGPLEDNRFLTRARRRYPFDHDAAAALGIAEWQMRDHSGRRDARDELQP